MTTRRQAAPSKGGVVLYPLISQIEASEVLGQPISDEAWKRVERAFNNFGFGMDNLATSRPNRSKNDPQSWGCQQAATVADLDRAFDCLTRVTSDRVQFLRDACDNYSLQSRGHSGLGDTLRILEQMQSDLIRITAIVDRAEPIARDVPAKATLRSALIREIWDALRDNGLAPARASRWASVVLAPFERLLLALGVKKGNSDEAFTQLVKRAVGKG